MLEELNTEDVKKKLQNTQYVKGVGLIDTDKFLLEVRRNQLQKQEEERKNLTKGTSDGDYVNPSHFDPEIAAGSWMYVGGLGYGDDKKKVETIESVAKGIFSGSYHLLLEGIGEVAQMLTVYSADLNKGGHLYYDRNKPYQDEDPTTVDLYKSGLKLSDAHVEAQRQLEESSSNKIAFQLGQGAGTILSSAVITTTGALLGGAPLAIGLGFTSSAIIEGGTAHRTAREYGLNEEDAANVGTVVGLVNGALEFLPIIRGLKKIPGFKKLIGEVSEEVTSEIIKRGLFKTIVKEGFSQGLVEGGQEALQEITNLVTETLYKKTKDKPQWSEWRDRIAESAGYGAILGALFSGIGSVSSYNYAKKYETNKQKTEELGKVLKEQIDEHNTLVSNSQKVATGVEASIVSGLGTIPVDLSKSGLDAEKIKAAKEKAEKGFPFILGRVMHTATKSKDPVSLLEIMYRAGESLLDSFFTHLNNSLDEGNKVAHINPKDGDFRKMSKEQKKEFLQKLGTSLGVTPAFNNSKLAKKIAEYAEEVLKEGTPNEVKQAFINDVITSTAISPVNLKGNAKAFKLKTTLKTYIKAKYAEALKSERVIARAFREEERASKEDLGQLAKEAIHILTPKLGAEAAKEQALSMGREALEELVLGKASSETKAGYDFNVVDKDPFIRSTNKFVDSLANLWNKDLVGQKVTISHNGTNQVVTLKARTEDGNYLYVAKDEQDKEIVLSVSPENIVSDDAQDISHLRNKTRGNIVKQAFALSEVALTKLKEEIKETMKNTSGLMPVNAKVNVKSTAKKQVKNKKDAEAIPSESNIINFVPSDDPLYETPIEDPIKKPTPSFNLLGPNIEEFRDPKMFDITSTFDQWLDGIDNKLDLKKPFNIKNISPFGRSVIEAFREQYLAEHNFVSVPKERIPAFKKEWNDWLRAHFGLRHREGVYTGGPFYGLNSITKVDKKALAKGSEIIISGNFLFKDMPHEYYMGKLAYQVSELSQVGAGLGWYIYAEIQVLPGEEAIPFIYEWQSDILPDLFGQSVSNTLTIFDYNNPLAEGYPIEREYLNDGIHVRLGDKYYRYDRSSFSPIEQEILDSAFEGGLAPYAFIDDNGREYFVVYDFVESSPDEIKVERYYYRDAATAAEEFFDKTDKPFSDISPERVEISAEEFFDKADKPFIDKATGEETIPRFYYREKLLKKLEITKKEFDEKKRELQTDPNKIMQTLGSFAGLDIRSLIRSETPVQIFEMDGDAYLRYGGKDSWIGSWVYYKVPKNLLNWIGPEKIFNSGSAELNDSLLDLSFMELITSGEYEIRLQPNLDAVLNPDETIDNSKDYSIEEILDIGARGLYFVAINPRTHFRKYVGSFQIGTEVSLEELRYHNIQGFFSLYLLRSKIEEQKEKIINGLKGIKKLETKDPLIEKIEESNESAISSLANLYNHYWNIWLMHSFMYAKSKGKNTVLLPTGRAMKKIEGSIETAKMYATKFDLTKESFEEKKLLKDEENQKENPFKEVGPYWTALKAIKGIKLKLVHPAWSTVPLIEADISEVDTDAYKLFETDIKDDNSPKLPTRQNPLKVFVDGSDIKGTGQIGAGAWAEWNGEELKISITEESPEVKELKALFPEASFSNPTMEMLGLLTLLKSFEGTSGAHIQIFQDYKGAVNYGKLWNYSEGSEQRAAKPWKAKEPYIAYIVSQIEERLQEIEDQGGSVKLTWVKGHQNSKGNIKADEIAKDRKIYNTFLTPDGVTPAASESTGSGKMDSRSKPMSASEQIQKSIASKGKVQVTKIISGGQIGADRAGLEAGKELGLQTGGVAPKGFYTKNGKDPSLQKLGLREVSDAETGAYTGNEKFYGPRTELNVLESDGTVLFGDDMNSQGSALTRSLAKKHNKPYIENPTAEELKAWLSKNKIKTLNVAGNRTADGAKIKSVLKSALKEEPKTTTPIQQKRAGTGEQRAKTVVFKTEESQKISQGEILSGFEGSTVGELVAFLKAQGIHDPQFKFIEELLTPILKDVVVKIEKVVDRFGNVKKAAWDNNAQVMYINPDFMVTKSTKVYFTALHEMVHAYLTSFIRSNTKEAKEFISKIRALMRTMKALVLAMEANDSSAFDGEKELFEELKKLLKQSPNLKQELALYLNPLDSKTLEAAELNGQTYYADIEEFLAGIMGGTTVFRDLAARTKFKVGYDMPSTSILQEFLKVISDLFRNLYLKIFGKPFPREKSELSILNELETILHSYADPIESFWNPSKGKAEEKPALLKKVREKELLDFSTDEDTKEEYYKELREMLDNMQTSLDDEDVETRSATNSFIGNLVKTSQIKFAQLVKNISIMSYQQFVDYVNNLDSSSQGTLSANIYDLWKTQGRKYEPEFDKYVTSFLVATYARLGNLTAKKTYNVITTRPKNISGYDRDFTLNYTPEIMIQPLGDEFKDTDGKRKSSLSEPMPIEGYVKVLGEILGLDPGDLEIAFINGFNVEQQAYKLNPQDNEYHKVGLPRLINKKNIKFLSRWDLGDFKDNEEDFDTDTVSEFLASRINGNVDKVNNRVLIFIGSFGDKRTLPVLTIPIDKAEKVVPVIEKFRQIYTKQILKDKIHTFKEVTGIASDQGAVLRLMLEDLWYNVPQESFGSDEFVSTVAKLDFKAVQKRATKWLHNDTRAISSPELLGQELIDQIKAGDFSGTSIDEKNNISFRTLIFDSDSVQKIVVDGVEYDLQKLLRNRRGTATTDGASFYILGEFDRIYRMAVGAIKKGIIKNIVSSRMGEKPLMIKHALHSLFSGDPLAKWMRQHNIAVIISDQAAKVGVASYGKISLAQLAVSETENDKDIESKIINIPLQKFSRIKEEESTDYMSGRPRQAVYGTSLVDINPTIKEADSQGKLVDALIHLGSTITKILDKKLKEFSKIENIAQHLEKIAANPGSPKQQIAAKLLAPVLAIKNPIVKANKLRSLIKHPIISEIINKRYKDALEETLEMTTPGFRGGLSPSIGSLAKESQVDPVQNSNNIKNMLLTLGPNSDVFKEALPDEILRKWIVELQNLQRQVSILLSKKKDATALKDQITEKKTNISKRFTQLASENKESDPDLSDRFREASKGNFINAISLDGPKAKKWSASFLKEALDENGLIQNGYVIITQDIAAKYGLKVGDEALFFVTPTDGPTAISVQKIAAILPVYGANAISEKNKVIMNSEYIQTIVGKDFDVDTIAALTFDPEFWEVNQWRSLLESIRKITGSETGDIGGIAYVKDTIKIIQKVLGPKIKVTKDNYTSDEIRIKYAQALLGKKNAENKTFAGMGKDFFEVNDAYQRDVAPIISTRLIHTLLSSIRMRANNVEIVTSKFSDGRIRTSKKVTFNIANSDWMKTHILHQILTHHILDFPNNTSILEYNSDLKNDPNVKRKMFEYMWGLEGSEEYLSDDDIDTINEFISVLFDKALKLPQQKDPDTFERASYFTQIQMIEDAKDILDMLKTNDKVGLKTFYSNFLLETQKEDSLKTGRTPKTSLDKVNQNKLELIEAFIDKLETTFLPEESGLRKGSAIFRYPLFNIINKIPALPFVGFTQKENVNVDTITANTMVFMYPKLASIVKSIISDKVLAKWFIDRKTGQKYAEVVEESSPNETSIAVSLIPWQLDYLKKRSGTRPLSVLRKAAIAIIHGMNELEIETREDTRGTNLDPFTARARAKSFPVLFKALLAKNTLTYRGNSRVVNLKGKVPIQLTVDKQGKLIIHIPNIGTYDSDFILNSPSKEGIRLRQLLTEEGGVWEDYDQRVGLSNFLYFSDNLNLEERIEALRPYLWQELYYKDFDRLDQLGFWVSMMGHLSNAGIRDKNILGSNIGLATMNPLKPYEYQSDTVLAQLLYEYERGLFNDYIYAYTEIAEATSQQNHLEVVAALKERPVEVGEILYESEIAPSTDEETVEKEMFSHIQNMANTIKSSKWKSFEAILNNDYGIDNLKLRTEKQVSEGLKALKDLLEANSLLKALNETNGELANILDDAVRFTNDPAKFIAKYKKTDADRMYQIFTSHLAASEEGLKSRVDLYSHPALKQLYYLALEARDSLSEAIGKKDLSSVPILGGIFAFEGYALKNEHKNYAGLDRKTPVAFALGVDKLNPIDLTIADVETAQKLYPGTQPLNVGESSIAFLKKRQLDMALTTHSHLMLDKINDVEDIIERLTNEKVRSKFITGNAELAKSSPALQSLIELYKAIDKDYSNFGKNRLNKLKLRELIFRKAEDLYKRENIWVSAVVSEDVQKNTIRQIMYHIRFMGKTYSYDNINDFLTNYVTLYPTKTSYDKLILLGALKYREMYDILTPNILHVVLNYLNRSIQYLSESQGVTEGVLQLIAIRERYTQYQEATRKRSGNYMPHAYPIEEFKIAWYSHYATIIKNNILQQIEVNKKLKEDDDKNRDLAEKGIVKRSPVYYDSAIINLDPNQINAHLVERLNAKWKNVEVGISSTSYIPNFLERKIVDDSMEYDITTMHPHQAYIRNLMRGIRQDLMTSDYFSYLERARFSGERVSVIEATKKWFADQSPSKVLHTRPLPVSKIKKGMEINFSLPRRLVTGLQGEVSVDEVQVWGIVKEIKDGKIKFAIDKESIISEILTLLNQNEAQSDAIALNFNLGFDDPITEAQMGLIFNLVKRGLITIPDSEEVLNLKALEANKFINDALRATLANPDQIGTYDIDELYRRDLSGNKVSGEVNRYVRRGTIERLQAKQREAKNRLLMVVEPSMTSNLNYRLWKATASLYQTTIVGLTRIRAIAFLGFAVAGRVMSTNALGGIFSKMNDSPKTSLALIRRGMREWGRIKHGHLDTMPPSDRKLFSVLKSLNLTSVSGLMKISLEDIGADIESDITETGALKKVGELINIFKDASGYEKYIKDLETLRLKMLNALANNDDAGVEKYNRDIILLKGKWKALINGYIKDIDDITEKDAIAGIVKYNKTPIEDRVPNIAEARGMTAKIALWKLAKLIPDDLIYQNYLGVKLQGLAEVLRRPTFFIGYLRAQDLGYSPDEQIMYGLNNVWYRDAFYGKSNKQFGANTKAGPLFYQFSQYITNAFRQYFRAWHQGKIQSLAKSDLKGKDWIAHKIDGIYTTIEEQLSKENKADRRQEFDAKRAIIIKSIVGMMLMEVGNRAIWGLTGSQDPVIQSVYGILDFISKIAFPNPDDSDDDFIEDIYYALTDIFFFMGAGNATMLHIALSGPKKGLLEGRPEQQVREATKLYNTVEYLIRGKDLDSDENDKTFTGDQIDNLVLNLELWGYTNPADEEIYVDDYNFIWGDKERRIRPSSQSYETFQEEGQGIDFKQRARMLFQPRTYIPLYNRLDKAINF